MNDILAVRGQAIKLGFQGENNAKRIIFDLSEFIEEYGPGTATVFYQQQKDPAPYPVITEQEGNKLYWTVKDTETHIKGYGLAQLVYTVGDTVAKTCLFETHILRSLSEPTDPPEGYESWINNLLEKAAVLEADMAEATELIEEVKAEVEEAKAAVEEIEAKLPEIQEAAERAESAAETATTAANSAENYAQNASESADRAEAAAESVKANHIRLYSNGTVIFNQDRTAPITFDELHELVSDTSKMVTIDNQGTQIFYLGTIFDDSVEFFETYIFEGKATAARMIMNVEGQLKWDEIDLASKETVDTLSGTVTELTGTVAEQSAKIEEQGAKIDAIEKTDKEQDKQLAILWAASKGKTFTEYEDTEKAYSKAVDANAFYGELEMLGGQSVVWNQLCSQARGLSAGGITVTKISNNKCSISGTSTVNSTFWLDDSITTKNGHKYLAWFSNHAFNIYFATTAGSSVSNYHLLINGNGTHIYYGLAVSIGEVFDGETYLHLCDLTQLFGTGNEPTSVDDERIKLIEQYAEEHPEYNEGEILSALADKVVSRGKNLFDNTNWWTWGEINADGTETAAKFSVKSIEYTPVKASTIYSIEALLRNTVRNFVFIAYYDSNKKFITRELKQKGLVNNRLVADFTTPSNCEFIRLSFNAGGDISRLPYDIQIESGTTSTEYKPYFSTDYPIPTALTQLDGYGWGVGDVFNEVDFVNKKYVQRVGLWELTEQDLTTAFYNESHRAWILRAKDDSINPSTDSKNSLGVCNRYEVKTDINIDGLTYGEMYFNNAVLSDSKLIVICDITSTTSPSFLIGTRLIYVLNTPIETDISDLLEGFDNELPIEGGGSITFNQLNGTYIQVPNKEKYLIKVV